MRLYKSLAVAVLFALTACAPSTGRQHAHSTTKAVNVRQVRNSSDNSLAWWYIIYANSTTSSCPCYVASSPTRATDMSSLSFARSATIPATAGNTAATRVEAEEKEEVANEELPADTEAELAQDEAVEDAASEDSTASDEPSSSDDSSASESDGGGDSGGGDSGGGDSGGGDSGGGSSE